jgi:Flp pilus assembly protein TadD
LELAEKAVRQRPEDPRIRDTYGTILFKLERYRESASELNLALQGAQNPKQIHDKLAAAYDKLGMVQQARIHREKSDSMEKETKKQ